MNRHGSLVSGSLREKKAIDYSVGLGAPDVWFAAQRLVDSTGASSLPAGGVWSSSLNITTGVPTSIVVAEALPSVDPISWTGVGHLRVDEVDIQLFDVTAPQFNGASIETDYSNLSSVTTPNLSATPIGAAFPIPAYSYLNTGNLAAASFPTSNTRDLVAPTQFSGTTTSQPSSFKTSSSVTMVLSLYVCQVKFIGGSYSVRDPLNITTDANRDYLDLLFDCYEQPIDVSGFTGRSWRLRLPQPIILGVWQALVLTISPLVDALLMTIRPFVRARTSVLGPSFSIS